jgi:hypothetical protein
MVTEQKKWISSKGWESITDHQLKEKAQLVLVFGQTALVKDEARYKEIASWYPKAHIVVCSTAGEIINNNVLDNTLVVTAIHFTNTTIQCVETKISDAEQSRDEGKKLAGMLNGDGLVHVLVFSEGLIINGSKLVSGLHEILPPNVSVTGGLVGDGANFKETVVGLDKPGTPGTIVAVGLYGTSLRIGYGSMGGWDPFGLERTITKATNNILYELDNKPALALYKEYLGEQAKELPGSGLLFPLSVRMTTANGQQIDVVRTILAVDETNQSITFAGDMQLGAQAKLMKANFDRLIEGASGAASKSAEAFEEKTAELAILISCVGRKLVLKERVEEEIEAVRESIGPQAAMTGFYSYGELCPTVSTEKQCQLHNQTMTVTILREA